MVINQVMIFLAIGVMLLLMMQVETDLITWVFFVLNMIQLAFLIRGSSDSSEAATCRFVSQVIKIYALVVLMIQILFISFVGAVPTTDPKSVDQWIYKNYPTIYMNLDIIGLRSSSVELFHSDKSEKE